MLLTALILIALGIFINGIWLWVFSIPGILLAIFTLNFFRDPKRKIPPEAIDNPAIILSPADGKIVEIVEEDEPKFVKGKVIRISIFLSIFNVHVNRSPISGKVEYFSYNPGAYIIANHPKASELNENTFIGVKADVFDHKIAYKQMTGILARRIVCIVKEGDEYIAGEKIGMMKFGSRMDVFLPVNTNILVKKGDNVKGASSILAELKE